MIFLFGGCLKPFDTKEQAKNEVNKKGYRVGRWVDYLDSTGVKTKDEVNYKSYILSEYKDGRPLGFFREFNSNDVLISNGSFKTEGILCDMNTLPQLYVGCREFYDDNQNELKINGKEYYSPDGELEKEIFYKHNQNTTDSISIKYEYFGESKETDSALTNRSIKEIMFYKNDTLDYKLTFDEKPWTEGLKKSEKFVEYVIDKLSPSLRKQKFKTDLAREVFDYYADKLFKPDYFNRLHFVYVRGDDINKNEELDIKKQMVEGYQIWLSSVDVTSSSIATCSYCGRSFNKQVGFVSGAQSIDIKSYSSVLFEMEVAKQIDPAIAKTLMWNYNYGTWYCSRQCVFLSGHNILE